MVSPVAQPTGPDPAAVHPPAAEPVAIRACLTPDVAAVFDVEWEIRLEQAKRSKDLAGVRDLLQHWRHFAYQELREPGAYFRVLATATRAQVTRQAPAGSVSDEQMRTHIAAGSPRRAWTRPGLGRTRVSGRHLPRGVRSDR